MSMATVQLHNKNQHFLVEEVVFIFFYLFNDIDLTLQLCM